MKAKDEGLFFYRSQQFQTQSRTTWGAELFVESTQKPENFSTFWDNIYTGDKNLFAEKNCNILKQIKIEDMHIDFQPGKGLFITDKNDEDMCAVIDYRGSDNGELRGQFLAESLKKYSTTQKKGSVYDALNNMLHSPSYNPTFAQGVKRMIPQWAQSIAMSAIETVLSWKDKLTPARRFSPQDKENERQIDKLFPVFLAILDEKNIVKLKENLNSPDFLNKNYADARKTAIEKLLSYRYTLFAETETQGINIKDIRKSDKCHFSEQMITALVQNEPKPDQSFENYIESCIKKAEENLTPNEIKNWPKGVFSHRLLDIVTSMKKMIPEQSGPDVGLLNN